MVLVFMVAVFLVALATLFGWGREEAPADPLHHVIRPRTFWREAPLLAAALALLVAGLSRARMEAKVEALADRMDRMETRLQGLGTPATQPAEPRPAILEEPKGTDDGEHSGTRVHLSHSQVGEFLGCPRRYHLHCRLGLAPAFTPSWLQFGIGVHEALALYHQSRLEGKDASLRDLVAAYRTAWDSCELPVKLKEEESAEDLQEKAGQMLAAYMASPHTAGEVIALEEPFRIRLSEDLPDVEGRIDLVEKTSDGGLVLTDFKTAASKTEPEPAQLVLYREALRVLDYPGGHNAKVRFVVLVKTKTPQVVVYEPELKQGSVGKLTSLYEAVWRDIERGASFPVPGWQCEDCAWQEACDQC